MNSSFPEPEEWENMVKRFYTEATKTYKYRIVKFQNESSTYVDWARAYSPLPSGSTILDFDDVFSNEEAMNLLMSWAVSQYFPEDE